MDRKHPVSNFIHSNDFIILVFKMVNYDICYFANILIIFIIKYFYGIWETLDDSELHSYVIILLSEYHK